MPTKKGTKISPKIVNTVRDPYSGVLAPEVLDALKEIARMEGWSVARVIERMALDYLGLSEPKYMRRKRP